MKRVLITGSTGLIGRHLTAVLRDRGDEVVGLTRGEPPTNGNLIRWDPSGSALDPALVSGFDAVVHLAGENIGEGRWTSGKKARIRGSRVRGTRLLSETLAQTDSPPEVFISSSAVGYYGNRGSDILTEDSGPGDGFLAEVAVAWESAADPAREAGIRVIHPRTGPTLSTLLSKMLTPFKMGLGGVVAGGSQYLSWIALDDAVTGLCHLIDHGERLPGPVNLVAPNPVTNREMTHALGRAIRRPTAIPVPAAAARLVLGEMADELLLASQRVSAERLQASGFEFQFPELAAALDHALTT